MPDRADRPAASRATAQPATTLRSAVRGVEGLVLDADGVIFLKGRAIPGSIEALRSLEARGIPYRVVTNFSQAHRSSLAASLRQTDGLVLDPDRIITASSAAAAYTAAAFAGRPIVVVAALDARREFDGQDLRSIESARDLPDGTIAAVVVGDAGDELSYRAMDGLFRLVRGGAAFLAMHRNPWWLTPAGPTLDAGAAVVGLEYATDRRATILGKPSPVVFRQALAGLRRDLGRRVPARDVAMVGDDPDADVRAAQRVGMRGILVLSGKTSAAVADAAMPARRRRSPDAIAPALADVVAALD